MRRYIEKHAFLPIKWWIKYKRSLQSIHVKQVDELLEKKTELEQEWHDAKRKNDQRRQDKLEGFIQAIDWVCDQSKYKQ